MQEEMNVAGESPIPDIPDEELIDTLIAISVVSKRLAHKLRIIVTVQNPFGFNNQSLCKTEN